MARIAQLRWSQAELRVCVKAYRDLLMEQETGRTANKTEMRNRALVDLPLREKGAYEFRMQNISAVLDELGLKTVQGYLPRRNIGRAKVVLIDLINDLWERETRSEAATDDPVALRTRAISASRKLNRLDVPKGVRTPARKTASGVRFVRDPNVIAWILATSAGRCEVCDAPAPFETADGLPYLEVHHVRPLAEGGPDTTDNAAAACPNCHRRLHLGADAARVRVGLIKRVPRLEDHPKIDI